MLVTAIGTHTSSKRMLVTKTTRHVFGLPGQHVAQLSAAKCRGGRNGGMGEAPPQQPLNAIVFPLSASKGLG